MFGMLEIFRNFTIGKGRSSHQMSENPGRSSSQTKPGQI